MKFLILILCSFSAFAQVSSDIENIDEKMKKNIPLVKNDKLTFFFTEAEHVDNAKIKEVHGSYTRFYRVGIEGGCSESDEVCSYKYFLAMPGDPSYLYKVGKFKNDSEVEKYLTNVKDLNKLDKFDDYNTVEEIVGKSFFKDLGSGLTLYREGVEGSCVPETHMLCNYRYFLSVAVPDNGYFFDLGLHGELSDVELKVNEKSQRVLRFKSDPVKYNDEDHTYRRKICFSGELFSPTLDYCEDENPNGKSDKENVPRNNGKEIKERNNILESILRTNVINNI